MGGCAQEAQAGSKPTTHKPGRGVATAHTHTHTHTFLGLHRWRHSAQGCRMSRARAKREGKRESAAGQVPCAEARKLGSALSGITPRLLVSKMPCKKRLPFIPGSGEARERGERCKAAGPN